MGFVGFRKDAPRPARSTRTRYDSSRWRNTRFVAEVEGLEVTLRGTGAVAVWRDHLGRISQLEPAERDGRVPLMLSAIATTYKGVRFSELVIAVELRDARPEGVFLAGAYNTSRLFTFFEKHWFGTPYRVGDVHVLSEPAGLDVVVSGEPRLRARMAPRRGADRIEDERWDGAIHLPQRGGAERYFVARLEGSTESIPFDARDAIDISPVPDDPALAALAASGFQPTAWSVRRRARHARSKTITA